MGENQKSVDGLMEKLGLITDGIQNLFPEGKSVIVTELNYEDFKKIQRMFRTMDSVYDQFKIDVSGTEYVFVLENSLKPKKIEETIQPKKNIWEKLLFWKRSKPSV